LLDGLSIQHDGTTREGNQTGYGAKQLTLSITVNSCNTDNLTVMDIKVQVLDLYCPILILYFKVLQAELYFSDLLIRFLDFKFYGTTYHHLSKLLLTDIGNINSADIGSSSQYCTTVRDFLDLPKLVGDKQNGLALSPESLENFHQFINLLRGKNRSGFVKDDDVCITVEGLENLDTLLLSDRYIFDQGIWVNLQAILLAEFSYTLTCTLQVENSPLHRFHSQYNVLCDREVLYEFEVLVHHADSQ